MNGYAFNTRTREQAPESMLSVLDWLARNTRPVCALAAEPVLARQVLDAATSLLDGSRAAPDTVRKHKMLLNQVLNYAVELQVLSANPIAALKITSPKVNAEVDIRTVVNHAQARRLLAAVSTHVGEGWTDSGRAREERGLKQRAVGQTRFVPMAPPLVSIMREHLDDFDAGPDGLLFYGVRSGKPVALSVYRRVWATARRAAFSDAEYNSLLARRPYDLRHACVSTWLAAGVPAPEIAAWAGHSVDMLLRVYAQCIDGQTEASHKRIERILEDHKGA
jgi:integrase